MSVTWWNQIPQSALEIFTAAAAADDAAAAAGESQLLRVAAVMG